MEPEIQAWFDRAREDLAGARKLLQEPPQPGLAAFHLQQALEKILKGYLRSRQQRPPRIHNLVLLLKQATDHGSGLGQYGDLCKDLNRAYIETRYPGSGNHLFDERILGEYMERVEGAMGAIEQAALESISPVVRSEDDD